MIAAAALTVRVAALELVLPQRVDATQRYWLPFIPAVTAVSVREEVVLLALVQVTPPSVLTCHWKLVAAAEVILNEALLPAQTVWLAGCAVMAGPVPALIV